MFSPLGGAAKLNGSVPSALRGTTAEIRRKRRSAEEVWILCRITIPRERTADYVSKSGLFRRLMALRFVHAFGERVKTTSPRGALCGVSMEGSMGAILWAVK
jgi:hypothetical protein